MGERKVHLIACVGAVLTRRTSSRAFLALLSNQFMTMVRISGVSM